MQHERIEQPENPELDIRMSVGEGLEPPVSLSEWQPESDAVALTADDNYSTLREHLDAIKTIAIAFGDATDGRGFTVGRTLRDWGFNGELRATGSFARDQLHYLRRCGFNAFELPEGLDAREAARSLFDFSIRYQTVEDRDRPIHLLMR